MSHVEVSTQIKKDADALWSEIGSFQSVGRWHPMLAQVEGHGNRPGSVRTAIGKDGSKQIERLQEANDSERFYRYAMLSSAMPVSEYTAELRVRDDSNATSTVLWSSDFYVTSGDEQQTAGLIRQFFTAGLENLRKKYQ